eukprot:TRINITY_DN94533_c0_g1_i1.p1 TRINITY_DN94533_c0_g1~~TRINITY_DN94533_c0_g1_i1.p1  ORF type:complete len:252 (+),score=56.56 TRINITY_DN94533_c0_g1_i1:65-820(+)
MPIAAVLGSSGAVGQEVVKQLVGRGPEKWTAVHLLNRRPIEKLSKLDRVTEHVVDIKDVATFEEDARRLLEAAKPDAVFCTMGVGSPSKATEDELRRVDVELPSAFARGAKACGTVRHFSLLSALSADAAAVPSAFPFFRTAAGGGLYLQCKGNIEQTVLKLQFQSFSTFRPAALIGTPNTPPLVTFLSPFLDQYVPTKWRSSNINTLAAAMVLEAEQSLEKGGHAMKVREAETLQDYYKEIPFPHGPKSM